MMKARGLLVLAGTLLVVLVSAAAVSAKATDGAPQPPPSAFPPDDSGAQPPPSGTVPSDDPGIASPQSHTNGTAHLDWCPGTADLCQDSSYIAILGVNTSLTMSCWIDARKNGYTYPRWFYVTVTSGTYSGKTGFVKAELVASQVSTPNCRTNKRINASLWTTWYSSDTASWYSWSASSSAEYHRYTPTSTDRSTYHSAYPGDTTGWGTLLDWSGDCVKFAALAWWVGGQKTYIHTAATAYNIGKSYSLSTSSTPPRGALVFWSSNGGPPGHVAISIGNGRVVGTWGLDAKKVSDEIQIQSYRISSITGSMGSGSYMGWVQPG
jgi:CHAP domain